MKITHDIIAEYFFFFFRGIKESGNIFLGRNSDGCYFISTIEGTPTEFSPTELKAKDFYYWMVKYKNRNNI